MNKQENNALCAICGNPYYLCFHCKDKMKLHPYKIYCCSPSHFQVFQVVRGFSTGVYDKDEFKSKLLNMDLNDLENYREHIKTLIKDALKEEKVEAVVVSIDETAELAEKVENTVVEDVVVEDVSEIDTNVEVKIEETVAAEDIVKPTVSRKRNYRVEAE